MSVRGQTIRYCPATAIPVAERHQQIERILHAVWVLASAYGFDLGRPPTIITHGAPMSPPATILGCAAVLTVESLAVTHLSGVSDTLTRAIAHIVDCSQTSNTTNLQHLIDEDYNDTEEDAIHQ
jgi:hypothetical protein